jgi:hypothetical protein
LNFRKKRHISDVDAKAGNTNENKQIKVKEIFDGSGYCLQELGDTQNKLNMPSCSQITS